MGEPHGGEVAPRTRDQLWRLLFFAAAALLLVGLGFDRWGSGDGTGSELAHSVVIVGGTVTILAAVILLLAPVFERRAERGGGWRVLQVAVPVLAVGVLGPAMVAAASVSHRLAPSPSMRKSISASVRGRGLGILSTDPPSGWCG